MDDWSMDGRKWQHLQHGKSKMSNFSYKDGQSMLGLVAFSVGDNTQAIHN